MARHAKHQDELPQENWTKKGRTFRDNKGNWSGNLSTETWKIHPVFHATLLRQYKETDVYGANFPRPPPDIIEGEETYEVERILKHRKRG